MDVLQRLMPSPDFATPALRDRPPTPVPHIIITGEEDSSPEEDERQIQGTTLKPIEESEINSHAVIPSGTAVVEDFDKLHSSFSDRALADYCSTVDSVEDSEVSDRTTRIKNCHPLLPGQLPKEVGPRRRPGLRPLHRSSSNSGLETISEYKKDKLEEKHLQRQVRNPDISPTDTPPRKPWMLRRVHTAPGLRDGYDVRKHMQAEPRIVWIPGMRLSAETSCRMTNVTPIEKFTGDDCRTPLRTCLLYRSKSAANSSPSTLNKPYLKQTSKSAANSPPSELNIGNDSHSVPKTKAVDFRTLVPIHPAPLRKRIAWISNSPTSFTSGNTTPSLESVSFFGFPPKSRAAEAALTRTDVHVIAVASGHDDADHGSRFRRTATPTKQIVESGIGNYEVTWDKAPNFTQDTGTRRRKSIAGKALETAANGPSFLSSSNRANAKLTNWGMGSPFEPTTERERQRSSHVSEIIVFPDESSKRKITTSVGYNKRSTHFDSTSHSSEDSIPAHTQAPPNSVESSVLLPRPSPHGSSTSTATTIDSSPSTPATLSRIPLPPSLAPQPQAEQDLPTLPFSATSDNFLNPQAAKNPHFRQYSNLDTATFQNHRDSVTLARARLAERNIGCDGVDPERFRHRNSVIIAKRKREERAKAGMGRRRLESLSEGAVSNGGIFVFDADEDLVKDEAHVQEVLREETGQVGDDVGWAERAVERAWSPRKEMGDGGHWTDYAVERVWTPGKKKITIVE